MSARRAPIAAMGEEAIVAARAAAHRLDRAGGESGRGELSAGDQLVLRHLKGLARDRQQFGLGLPLLALGSYGLWRIARQSG